MKQALIIGSIAAAFFAFSQSGASKKTDADKRSEIKAFLASSHEKSDWVDKLTPSHLKTLYGIFEKYLFKRITPPREVLVTFWGIMEQYGFKQENS